MEDYTLEGLLGQGGYSDVFSLKPKDPSKELPNLALSVARYSDNARQSEARSKILEGDINLTLPRDVALAGKSFHTMASEFDYATETLNTVQSPHIPYYFDEGFLNGAYCILREAGKIALEDWLKTHRILSVENALVLAGILLQALIDVLEAGKKKGVHAVHGDVGRENVFGNMIGDWGIGGLVYNNKIPSAKVLWPEKMVRGTPLYVAPELWINYRSITTDVYALGITLYYLLTGQDPYPNMRNPETGQYKKPHSLGKIHWQKNMIPLEDSPELNLLLGLMLTKKPQLRISHERLMPKIQALLDHPPEYEAP